jgi:hypothetical protein
MANYKQQLRYLALVAFVLALLMTALGGLQDMTGKTVVLTKEHSWNDGIFLMLGAIFLLILSFF